MGHDQTDKVGCHCSVAFLFITDNKPNRFPNFYLFLWRVCFSQTIVCFHNRLGKLILIDFVMHRLMDIYVLPSILSFHSISSGSALFFVIPFSACASQPI